MVSVMATFTAYFSEGLTLALALANVSSHERHGVPAGPQDAVHAVAVRVNEPVVLYRLSERLRAIAEQQDPARAVPLLNRLLSDYEAAPELALESPGRWRLHLHPAHATAEALDAVKAASGLAALIDRDGWSTLKGCAASHCDDLFGDQSRNNGRRFCTRTCANRINAQRARARLRPPRRGT